jgi:hypothetical protein
MPQMVVAYFPCENGKESEILDIDVPKVMVFWQELFLEVARDMDQQLQFLIDAKTKLAKQKRIFDRCRIFLFCPYAVSPDEHKRYLATGNTVVCELLRPSGRRGQKYCENIVKELCEMLRDMSAKYDRTVTVLHVS